MKKAVVIGGGWAGVAAAVRIAKRGMKVILCEKSDMLLGLGNVGGIIRNNGRFAAAEENIALGAWELFEIADRFSIHRNVDFPGHAHASFYDAVKVEPAVCRLVRELGVEVRLKTRATDVAMESAEHIGALFTAGGEKLEADVFVEATGSAGPMGNCMRYGNGCSMCVLRCPSFGPRVSITERAGLDDLSALRADGKRGAFSGSCKLEKRSLSKHLQKKLKKDGFAVIPLPPELVNREKLAAKVCKQYALDAYAENLVLIDTGDVKLMTPYFDLETLRHIDGFENARFRDPYAGGKGNSIRYMAVGMSDKNMRARGIDNLFLAGEKAGFFIGHTEAVSTGSLAGHNAAMYCDEKQLLELPAELATGDLIRCAQEALTEEGGLERRFTFAGGEFFERMKTKGLDSAKLGEARRRVYDAGLLDVYNRD